MLNGTRNRGMVAHSHFGATAKRVKMFATLLLADSSTAGDLATELDTELAEQYMVLVVHISGLPRISQDERQEKIVESLLKRWRAPILWEEPVEFLALLPSEESDLAQTRESALGLAGDLAAIVELPCSAGVATGRTGALGDTARFARRVSQAAPAEAPPSRLYTIADVFVELGVTQLPQVERWLRGLAQRLTSGPDLIATLDVYYRNDMNRLSTASSLCIHPRTLDYRLQRVRTLVGMDPGSTRGVRVLTATVARALAGA
jgi:sugar diacid utilization regulator